MITEAPLPGGTHAARVRQGEQNFIYSVAHDLRAPLRGLNGYSTALLEEYGGVLGERGRGYAERIAAASEQMAQLIEDLLELSRLSQAELRLQPVDLGAEAARISAEIQLREPSLQSRFAIQRPVPIVADRKLICIALQHLLDNAWKFTSGQDHTLIEFGTAASGNAAICCYVRDNGAGFDPAHAGKLFQPFGRLHSAREYPGSGVGLAGVRQIVESHGGRVWATGAPGEGATFYFTLGEKEII